MDSASELQKEIRLGFVGIGWQLVNFWLPHFRHQLRLA
jgi:hypothetical protein